MSALDDLIREISNRNLRRSIEKEAVALKVKKKFGLVAEPQNPKCTPFFDVPVQKKSLVVFKAGKIVSDSVSCVRIANGEEITCNKDDLIGVAHIDKAKGFAEYAKQNPAQEDFN